MTILIMRHGHKEQGYFFNPKLRHQDPPLSETGNNKAKSIVPYFSERAISSIYISQYLRTRQTIEPLSKSLGIPMEEDLRLNELDNGLIDNMTEEEFKSKFPAEWEAYHARMADFRFPGGETGKDASERIERFLIEKREKHKNENILVVSHDGLIRVCMCFLMGIPVFHRGDFKVDLFGLTEIDYQADIGRWKLLRFNNVI
jgi:broad specificity phosphatase PhoE